MISSNQLKGYCFEVQPSLIGTVMASKTSWKSPPNNTNNFGCKYHSRLLVFSTTGGKAWTEAARLIPPDQKAS